MQSAGPAGSARALIARTSICFCSSPHSDSLLPQRGPAIALAGGCTAGIGPHETQAASAPMSPLQTIVRFRPEESLSPTVLLSASLSTSKPSGESKAVARKSGESKLLARPRAGRASPHVAEGTSELLEA
jgi:hypothetical protein